MLHIWIWAHAILLVWARRGCRLVAVRLHRAAWLFAAPLSRINIIPAPLVHLVDPGTAAVFANLRAMSLNKHELMRRR